MEINTFLIFQFFKKYKTFCRARSAKYWFRYVNTELEITVRCKFFQLPRECLKRNHGNFICPNPRSHLISTRTAPVGCSRNRSTKTQYGSGRLTSIVGYTENKRALGMMCASSHPGRFGCGEMKFTEEWYSWI